MTLKTEVSPSNTVVTVEAAPNADGSPAVSRWSMLPDQAEKHIEQFSDARRPAADRMKAGDVSAIADAANEFRKQRDS